MLIATTKKSFSGWRGLRQWLALGALLPALLIAGSCDDDNDSPTNPSGVANVAGTWAGTFRIAACTDTLNGAPGTVCSTLSGTTAPLQSIRLALQQTDDRLVGNIQFSGWSTRSLLVTGVIQPGGAVLLEGTTTWTEPNCATATTQVPGRLQLTLWNSLVNRTSDGMTGDFRVSTTTRTTPCAFGEVSIQADTLQLTKQ